MNLRSASAVDVGLSDGGSRRDDGGHRRRATRRGLARRVALTGLVVLAAAWAAELFLRQILPFEIAFQTWYTPGIHVPSSKHGYLFAPGYEGVMWHVDGVAGVPLRLDRHGNRLPALVPEQDGAYDVVLLGGESMIFAYGLPDKDCPHQQMAKQASCPMNVYNVAGPGQSLYRTFHIYRATLEKDLEPDLVIICLYSCRLEPWQNVPEDFEQLPEPRRPEKLFQFVDGLAVAPRGGIPGLMGRQFYRSFLFARLALNADRWQRRAEIVVRRLQGYARRVVGDRPVPSMGAAGKSGVATDGQASQREAALAKQVAFVMHICSYFEGRGAKTAVVFLPGLGDGIDSGPALRYAAVKERLPASIEWVDLHERLMPLLGARHWLADGHYDAYAAAQLGKMLAEEACQVLQRGP